LKIRTTESRLSLLSKSLTELADAKILALRMETKRPLNKSLDFTRLKERNFSRYILKLEPFKITYVSSARAFLSWYGAGSA